MATVDLSKSTVPIDPSVVDELKSQGLYNAATMWGATPGPSNRNRWQRMSVNDRILIYVNGKKFIRYGRIVAKTHNPELAAKIWGVDSRSGETWEYIYFITDLQEVDIPLSSFNRFFNYSSNFIPQGFSTINQTKVDELINSYQGLDNAIGLLADTSFKTTETQFEEQKDLLGENLLESATEKLNDEEYKNYLLSLNTSASISTVNTLVNRRKLNKTILDSLKERYSHKCQVCGFSAFDEFGVSIAEAHHIEPFSLAQNNTPENIMILCPNHHSLIHKAKGNLSKDCSSIEYSNGIKEPVLYPGHLVK